LLRTQSYILSTVNYFLFLIIYFLEASKKCILAYTEQDRTTYDQSWCFQVFKFGFMISQKKNIFTIFPGPKPPPSLVPRMLH